MEVLNDPVSVRLAKLNSQLVTSKPTQNNPNNVTQEGLLDAFNVLYEECNTEFLKKHDHHISGFVEKHRNALKTIKSLRVNLSDFEIKNVIGRGHFGEVRVVKEKQTGDVYAMKTIKKCDCIKSSTSFEAERNIMAFSESVWLTTLRYAFQDSSNLYFIMEYHPGGDLLGLLHREGGTIPESAATFYIAELVVALNDLHTMGYIHRDIKPENILLDCCGHIKLVDFGSAAKLNSRGIVTEPVAVGTPDYVAPEVLQCNDNKHKKTGYNISCDYWSVGVLAFQLTVGNTPFNGPNTPGTYTKIMNHKVNLKFPADIVLSQAYVTFVKNLLSDANSRLTYEQILKHPLFQSLDFNSLRDQVPPYVTKIKSMDDVSNFFDIPTKKTQPNIENFKTKTQFSGKQLPFIGFSYTCDNNPYRPSLSLVKNEKVDELEKEINDLQKQLLLNKNCAQEKNGFEKKLEDQIRQLESAESLRDRLEHDLANSLSECSALRRRLDLERKDRADLEHKALELIKSAKLKWEISEKTKVDALNLELSEQMDKIQQLKATNSMLNEQLQHALQLESKHKELKEELIAINADRQISLKDTIDHYSKHIEALKESLTKTTEEKKVLEVQLQESKANEISNKLKLQTLEDLLKRLESGVNKLETDSDKESVLKEQIERLEKQLIEVHERSVLEKEELNQTKLKYWRIEKELSNANIDKRILNREIKEAEDKNAQMLIQIDGLKSALSTNTTSHETALLELIGLNENLGNEIVKLRETIKALEGSLESEKQKSGQAEVTVAEMRFNISKKDDTIKTIKKDVEDLQGNINLINQKYCLVQNEKESLLKIINLSNKEKEHSFTDLQNCKTELQNAKLNLEALRGACTLLENQLIEYENIQTSYECQLKSSKANTEKLIAELASAKEEIQKNKKLVNEECSLKLKHETKCKRLAEDIESLTNELTSYKQQCTEFRDYSSSLTDELSQLEKKVSNYEVTMKSHERQISNLVGECNILKEENSKKLTHLLKVKESNFVLEKQLVDTKKNINFLYENIGELQDVLAQKENFIRERELKSSGTIQQQTKLIDFLQAKIEEGKKKKTFSDILFGQSKKENVSPNPIALSYKNMEDLLAKERDMNKQLRAEIVKLKYDLNHGKDYVSEKNVSTVSLKTQKMALKQLAESTPTMRNNDTYKENSDVKVEGWVKIPVRGNTGWEKHYASLTSSFLKIYAQPPNNTNLSPLEVLDLNPVDGYGTVILEPVSSEIHAPLAKTDWPFVLKVEIQPNTTCWPPKSLTLMTLSTEDKEKWSKALLSVFPIPKHKYLGDTVVKHGGDLDINCLVELNKGTKLLGTEQGLYSFSNGALLRIAGPVSVHQISILHHINLVVMIVDANRYLVTCDLNHLIGLTKCSACTKPTLVFKSINVNNLEGFHLFKLSNFVKQFKLCVATSKQIVIMKYDKCEFIPVRILDTAEPTSCMLFTEHSLIVGANKFFEIDLLTYEADEFLDVSDVKLSQAVMCYNVGSFPLDIIQISDDPIEYLLCFHEFGVFVDEYGRCSRVTDIKWNRLPRAFYFYAPYLYIVQFSCVEIVRIVSDTCNLMKNSIDSLLNVESNKIDVGNARYLGQSVAGGVYIDVKGEIRLIKGKREDSDSLSMSSTSNGNCENGNYDDEQFSFTSSMVHSLEENTSDTEDSSDEVCDFKPKKVTFSSITTDM